MARPCSICSHSSSNQIDRLLVDGRESLRSIGRRFDLSKDSLARHRDRHLQKTLVQAHEIQQVAHADDLLNRIRDLEGRTLAILDKAEAAGDLRAAITAIREARGCMELVGKATGELVERHAHLHAGVPMATTVAVELADSFHRLTQVIERSGGEFRVEDHLLDRDEALVDPAIDEAYRG